MRYDLKIEPEVQQAVDDIQARMSGGWHGQFYIRKGWWPLVAELHSALVQIDPNYEVAQVKEKFGGLRYYVAISKGRTEEMVQEFRLAIDQAERRSYGICEVCGRPGKLYMPGWMQTLCRNHYNRYRKIRKNDDWRKW